MKYFYTLLSITFFPLMIGAQPTITSDWLPDEGLELELQALDSSTVDPGPAGANVTWDMSGAVAIDTIPAYTQTYVDPAMTPYASLFPTANLAQETSVMGFSAYTYQRVSGNTFEFLGVGLPQGSIVYSDPELLMETPFTYNSHFEDDYEADVMISFFNFTEYGHVDVTGDAYGTLILPGETFEDVLRIRRYNNSRDTFSFFGSSTINISKDTLYQWVNEDYKSAILTYNSSEVITLELNPITMEYDTSSVEYTVSATRDLNAGATATEDIDDFTFEWSIYPNPAEDQIEITWPDEVEVNRILISDISGLRLQSVDLAPEQSRAEITLNSKVSAGLNILSLESADGELMGSKRLIRVR